MQYHTLFLKLLLILILFFYFTTSSIPNTIKSTDTTVNFTTNIYHPKDDLMSFTKHYHAYNYYLTSYSPPNPQLLTLDNHQFKNSSNHNTTNNFIVNVIPYFQFYHSYYDDNTVDELADITLFPSSNNIAGGIDVTYDLTQTWSFGMGFNLSSQAIYGETSSLKDIFLGDQEDLADDISRFPLLSIYSVVSKKLKIFNQPFTINTKIGLVASNTLLLDKQDHIGVISLPDTPGIICVPWKPSSCLIPPSVDNEYDFKDVEYIQKMDINGKIYFSTELTYNINNFNIGIFYNYLKFKTIGTIDALPKFPVIGEIPFTKATIGDVKAHQVGIIISYNLSFIKQ